MSNQIFKEQDRVYHFLYGWGEVVKLLSNNNQSWVRVQFDKQAKGFEDNFRDGFLLSFSEYTLEGFSQERPEEFPEKGQIVWVRDGKNFNWEVYHFLKHIPNAEYPYMVAQDCNEDNFEAFKYLTTINPYTYEK
jgi:hypothetical protein